MAFPAVPLMEGEEVKGRSEVSDRGGTSGGVSESLSQLPLLLALSLLLSETLKDRGASEVSGDSRHCDCCSNLSTNSGPSEWMGGSCRGAGGTLRGGTGGL